MTGVLAFYERIGPEVRVRIGREWVRVPQELQAEAYRALGNMVEAKAKDGALGTLSRQPRASCRRAVA